MNRLRAYRHIERTSQEEVSDQLGISPQMVSAIESGRRNRNFPLSLIGYGDDKFEVPNMSEPLHRQRARTRISDTKRAKELIRLGGEAYISLSAALSNAPKPSIERLAVACSDDEVDEAAVETRYMLNFEEFGPINNFTQVVERAGVCLVPLVNLEGIDGMSAWVDGVPVIGLSPSVPGDRFRFSLAHELGHLVMHQDKQIDSENQANRFAGSLLVPESELRGALAPETAPGVTKSASPTIRDFVNLKTAWGVSIAALVYRAHELKLITDKRYRSLQIQMSRWRKKEPGGFAARGGELLPKLVELGGGIVEVSQNFGLSSRHLAEIVNWKPLRVV